MGDSHPSRTASIRLANLANEIKTIKTITDAFSVEALSDEFFKKYLEIYADFVQHITGKRYVKENGKIIEKKISEPDIQLETSFNGNEKDVRDYVKKMLGRLVFLQFLQKKGWMGVPMDKNWGEGNQHYLQDLFAKSELKDDFLEGVLEVLFFDTLNYERDNQKVADILGLDIKIPYLNGGLFEKDDLDKKTVIFPANLFEKLLMFFSEYNFTIDENDQNDAEVGVDPEMLGRIFENLLEDNKDKGTFYTPKDIVSYMCKESLITYLKLKTDLSLHKAIENLILKHQVDDCLKIKKNAILINKLLRKIKICDPAIGSGAFPMGMLNEIFNARRLLYEFLDEKISFSACKIKKEIIQNNIYGVDIEKGAVDIARLRFWLALVVDEEVPQPLPNLDYKIMQGDSLLESFEGIDLSRLTNDTFPIVEPQYDLFGNIVENQLSISYSNYDDLKRLQDYIKCYFSIENHEKKNELKNLIDKEIHTQIELAIEKYELGIQNQFSNLGESTNRSRKQKSEFEKLQKELEGLVEKRNKLSQLQQTDLKPFFLWKLYFKDVFENGKFDIVIGNPPYVRQEKLPNEYKTLLTSTFPDVGNGTADLYVYFFGLGLNILAEDGVLMFITLNKYLKTQYGKELRNTLAEKVDVDLIIDFFELKVFQAATDAAITKIINCKSDNPTRYFPIKTLENLDLFEVTQGYYQTTLKDEAEWKFIDNLEIELLKKLQKDSFSLKEFTNDKIYSGIKTGYNKAFVLTSQDANKLINSESNTIVKKYAQSTDIKQWQLIDENRYFLATGFSLDIEKEYPTTFTYLSQFQDKLEARGDKGLTCYNLRPCAYYDEFDKPKIIYIHTAKNHEFYLDTDGCYINNSCYMIGSDSKFLFCFLNSKLFKWFKRIKFVAYGDSSEGGRCKLDYNKMVTVPIKKDVDETPFIELVEKIRTLKKEDINSKTQQLEEDIENLIYDLYNLTPAEIALVKSEIIEE
ncbi:MAG: Eco57I restriction-modification methylase domain-containing protein [Paludibacter sp.]|nr:Eco57I restriction-modification methylase domain-containing protein [Paludibacter sp.]